MLGLALITIIIILGILPAIAGEDSLDPTEGNIAERLITGLVEGVGDLLQGVGEYTLDERCDLGFFSDEETCMSRPGGTDPGSPDAARIRTSEELAREIRFQKQCFLAVNLMKVREKVSKLPNRAGRVVIPRRYVSVEGSAASPQDITSLIVSRPDLDLLLNVRPALLSYMMPSVRLYKVFGREGLSSRDSQNEETHEVEFLFDTNLSKERVQDIFNTRRGRGEGVGLLSFGWEFIGVNPAEVENNIKAELTLFFNNMRDFEGERTGLDEEGVERTYRFSDLIVPEYLYGDDGRPTEPGFDRTSRAYNPNFFRIKVVAGWEVPSAGLSAFRELYRETGMVTPFEEFLQIVRMSKKVMYLNLLTHNVVFGEEGTIKVNAQYQALVEGSFASEETDIINVQTGEDTRDVQKSARNYSTSLRRINAVAGQRNSPCSLRTATGQELNLSDPETLQTVRNHLTFHQGLEAQRLQLLQGRDRARAYHSIMEALTVSGKIYTLEVVPEDLGFASNADGQTFREMVQNSGEGMPEVNELSLQEQTFWAEAIRSQNPNAEIPALPQAGFMEWFQGQFDPTFVFNPQSRITPDVATLRRMIAMARLYGNPNFNVNSLASMNVSCAPGGDDAINPYLEEFLELSAEQDVEYDPQGRSPGYQTSLERSQMRRITDNIMRWIDRPYTTNEWESSSAGDTPKMSLNFMFFGDLLDIVIDRVSNALPPDAVSETGLPNNIQIYLGTFPYNEVSTQGRTGGQVYVPLAHIPISMELFSIWFLQEIVQPNRTSMTLRGFIRSVFDKLIVNAFGTECIFDPDAGDGEGFMLTQEHFTILPEFYTIPRRRLEQAGMFGKSIPNYLTMGNVVAYNEIFARLRPDEGARWNLLDRDRDYSYNDYVNVALYQAKSSDNAARSIMETNFAGPDSSYLDARARDVAKGVYHLHIGSDRGLVKSINFSRIDQRYMRESRIMESGEGDSQNQLRERYNATVTLFGNMFFYPGQYIYINPSMVGTNSVPDQEALTTRMGIGGYYLITRVENVVESGMYETRLACSWQYSGFRPIDPATGHGCLDGDFQTVDTLEDLELPESSGGWGNAGNAIRDTLEGAHDFIGGLFGGDS